MAARRLPRRCARRAGWRRAHTAANPPSLAQTPTLLHPPPLPQAAVDLANKGYSVTVLEVGAQHML